MLSLFMKTLRFLVISLLFASLFSCNTAPQTYKNENRILVILSLDGFRWDYPEIHGTPNLNIMAEKGVKAERLIPSFPSTTFANHYTIATGLYPDHHGILGNRFYDPVSERTYNDRKDRSTVEDGSFYGGEPIWVTAEKQGVKTATFFWVGSEADVMGIRPTYWKRYEHNFPYVQRLDTVMAWLQLPEAERPQLIMWYYDQPDTDGHFYGPEHDSLTPTIHYLDSLVGVFNARIATLDIADQIDFIVTADHGMAALSPERQIILDQHVDTSMIELIDGWNPTMNILAKDGYEEALYDAFSKIPNMRIWKHGEAPKHLHHGTHPRTHDMTLLADDGWSIFWSWGTNTARGTHGYDINNTDVHAIFYAQGQSFKENYSAKPFRNIHIYPLMAHILELKPALIDGSFDSIKEILK
jgi:alkaline phosphatase D